MATIRQVLLRDTRCFTASWCTNWPMHHMPEVCVERRDRGSLNYAQARPAARHGSTLSAGKISRWGAWPGSGREGKPTTIGSAALPCPSICMRTEQPYFTESGTLAQIRPLKN